jgi:Spy/CpxP family protein refolding chaperone
MKNTLAGLFLALTLAVALPAQSSTATSPSPGNHVQNHVRFLTSQLSLTVEQQSQAATIFTSASTAEENLHTSMKTAHQSLNDAVKSNNVTSIEQLSNTIGNLTGQMTLAQSKARAAFYQILTPEQQTKLQQIESQHQGFGGHQHPGMRHSGT